MRFFNRDHQVIRALVFKLSAADPTLVFVNIFGVNAARQDVGDQQIRDHALLSAELEDDVGAAFDVVQERLQNIAACRFFGQERQEFAVANQLRFQFALQRGHAAFVRAHLLRECQGAFV